MRAHADAGDERARDPQGAGGRHSVSPVPIHRPGRRPHLRRLEEAGLLSREIRKSATVGRPQTVYSAREIRNDERSDYRLLAEMLCGVVRTSKAMEEAKNL